VFNEKVKFQPSKWPNREEVMHLYKSRPIRFFGLPWAFSLVTMLWIKRISAYTSPLKNF